MPLAEAAATQRLRESTAPPVNGTRVADSRAMEEQAQALQESERKLNAAARLAHLGYREIDVVQNRVSWSEEGCHVLGVPVTERARSWDAFMELVHPDDRRARAGTLHVRLHRRCDRPARRSRARSGVHAETIFRRGAGATLDQLASELRIRQRTLRAAARSLLSSPNRHFSVTVPRMSASAISLRL